MADVDNPPSGSVNDSSKALQEMLETALMQPGIAEVMAVAELHGKLLDATQVYTATPNRVTLVGTFDSTNW